MTSEWRINNRRGWKAETFPYDYFIPDDSRECQYCLTDKQAEILRGIIEPLGWETRWWSATDTAINRDEIQAFRDDLIRRLMMSCCGDEAPDQFRWTEDGVLERSQDGGATWTPAPEFDPRQNSPRFPEPAGTEGASKRCIAATGMVAIIKQQIGDQLTDDMSHYTLGQLIADWVGTMIGTSNPFKALIVIAVNQIFALIISVLRAALTETVYDTLLCIFYCNMANDISFDEARLDQVTTDIGDQIGGIATLFFQQLINLLGVVGLTNLARAGGATSGDCSDCPECPSDWVRIYVSTGGGTETGWDGEWLYASPVHDGSHYTLFVQRTNPADTFDENFCASIEIELLTGTIDVLNSAMRVCGGSGLVPIGIAPFPGTCVCQVAIRNFEDVPFTVRMRAHPCS